METTGIASPFLGSVVSAPAGSRRRPRWDTPATRPPPPPPPGGPATYNVERLVLYPGALLLAIGALRAPAMQRLVEPALAAGAIHVDQAQAILRALAELAQELRRAPSVGHVQADAIWAQRLASLARLGRLAVLLRAASA